MAGERWCTSYTLIKITDNSIMKKEADGNKKCAFPLHMYP